MSNFGGFTDYLPRGLHDAAPLIGGGAASAGAVMARMYASPGSWHARNPDATGLMLSAAVAAAFAAFPSTRGASAMTLLGGIAASLPRILEGMASKKMAGVGYYTAETANPLLAGSYDGGMGLVQASDLNGLGYATSSQVPHAYGTVPGVAGPVQETGQGVSLLQGASSGTGSLSARYGATHWGR